MTTRSRPQAAFEKILSTLHISFMAEHQEFPPYELDVYLPEWHLCIEIDGPQHGPKRDGKRDDYLRDEYGIPTLRLKAEMMESQESRQRAQLKFLQFVEQWAESTAERKRIWRSRTLSS